LANVEGSALGNSICVFRERGLFFSFVRFAIAVTLQGEMSPSARNPGGVRRHLSHRQGGNQLTPVVAVN
jgi:hypothetical protein